MIHESQNAEDQYQEPLLVTYKREGKDTEDMPVNFPESNDKIELFDVKNLLFKFLIYQESTLHTVKFKFEYSFTQNQGLKNETVFHKSIEETVELKSESPFSIAWEVRQEDPFLDSLKNQLQFMSGSPSTAK